MLYDLLTLFISSFVSATLFPGGSELLLIYYLQNSSGDAWLYFSSATLGNSSGALLTYVMGYCLPCGRQQAHGKPQKAWQFCQRYGAGALLLSWLPVAGDLLPLAAGWLKTPVLRSVLAIIIGKAMRYGGIMSCVLYLL